jgi:hypothetical protein
VASTTSVIHYLAGHLAVEETSVDDVHGLGQTSNRYFDQISYEDFASVGFLPDRQILVLRVE